MDSQFHDTDCSLSVVLRRTVAEIRGESISLQQLLGLVGEQALLAFCTLLTVPFLFPVSIPGVSTVFGLVIIFIGVSVTLNRTLWLPSRVLGRQLASFHLLPVLERGIHFFDRLERWTRVRLPNLSAGKLANRLNGLALTCGGVLLLFPLSFLPFSNTLPALSVMLLALGMMQRDGIFIVIGYCVLLLTFLYFAGLAVAVFLGGQSLLSTL